MDEKLEYFSGDVILTPLKKIPHPKGMIYHAMKVSDTTYERFGEAYFSQIVESETKGWKKHTQMVLNLVVPVGDVLFYIYDEVTQETITISLGTGHYNRLTVRPHYWVAFRGQGQGLNLILNIASLEHDPDESINVPLESFPLTNTR
jgi:dTDP-4-dehydrorhamnose 3,5-epimerase